MKPYWITFIFAIVISVGASIFSIVGFLANFNTLRVWGIVMWLFAIATLLSSVVMVAMKENQSSSKG